MMLKDLLLQKRAVIIKRWFLLALETYPPDTSKFLIKKKNRFTNPVGYTINQSIEAIYDELLNGIDANKVSPFLDNMIRIRSVQDFSPSQALAFIFLLKKVIREEMDSEIRKHHLFEEVFQFNSAIDDLALIAFDIYMKCREKLCEIRVNELKRSSSKLLERANLILGNQEQESELKDYNI